MRNDCVRMQAGTQAFQLGKRIEINGEVLFAGDAGVVAGELVASVRCLDGCATERCRVHTKGREKLDVAPALQMLADPAALVNLDGELKLSSIQGRFQPN